MSVTVKIQNYYSDDYESKSEVLVDPPSGDLDEWWQEVVFPHTGDGHGVGRDLGSCYVATVIACDDPELLGESYEWID